jgi:hypothetical protein
LLDLFDVGGGGGAGVGVGAEAFLEFGLGFGVAVGEEQADAAPDRGVGGVGDGLEAAVDVEEGQLGLAARHEDQDAPLVGVEVGRVEMNGFFVIGEDAVDVDTGQVGGRGARHDVGALVWARLK